MSRVSIEGMTDQLGTTVADARRFARKASTVFVLFPCGPYDWQTGCLLLTRSAFLRSTSYKPDDESMPCKLYPSNGEFWLQIGDAS